MREVPLSEHTDEEFVEALFHKVTDGDKKAYQKHIEDFNKNF